MRSAKGDAVLTVSNLKSIAEFKQMYIDKIGEKDLKVANLRMFCLGKELKDELFLYSYDVMDEITIQVMIKK